jgi:hypothetical protein
MIFLLLKLDLDLCYMVDESYVMCILHVLQTQLQQNNILGKLVNFHCSFICTNLHCC